ncbi:MAG: DUF1622 domain-containing protein [Clostridia bacterium]|nr:DUF1622 domain-containing protein [Clostridia bacterium]
MYETLEHIFGITVKYGILLFETIGVIILLVSLVRALISLAKSKSASKIEMAEGITTALSFLLGSEVLKTIVAPDWTDIGMTCAVLLMRAGMSALIVWEGKHEKEGHSDPHVGKGDAR